MMQTKKVLLCGSSLFITGLQASLDAVAGLDLRRVQAQPDLLQKRLCEEAPDVLILELGTLPGDFSLTLLKEFPHLTLLGLDPESDRLLVLSGQSRRALTADDLLQVIESQPENVEVTAHMSHRAPRLPRGWAQALRPRKKARGR